MAVNPLAVCSVCGASAFPALQARLALTAAAHRAEPASTWGGGGYGQALRGVHSIRIPLNTSQTTKASPLDMEHLTGLGVAKNEGKGLFLPKRPFKMGSPC